MLLFPSDGSKTQESLQTVNAFGWRSFVQWPGDYNRNIVLEFYSNLNPVSRTSTVRGGGSLNVTGANFYQGTHVFVPTPLPTTMMDLNRGSGSTPSPMTFSSQPLSVFSNLEANHGVATTGGSSVPIQQDNGFDVNTYLDLFQGNGHEN
ncbi:PREDICTED: uncharacterized protein LOC109219681 isoform X2 [Nicotiana attenuata]|uniref:uncharacterized protein LOC109219681 isoform X2 n=1 Tax=Nicotiana attenuata TaxID=49451 RepID=UPI000904A165|nr:PREDICTED: uncharacterized protein LOC109219681 isoform X2 [Nicotiana attenuata]